MTRVRHVSDHDPGIRRIRRGRGFVYLRPGGQPVSQAQGRRIERLAIPPAWNDVWICHDPKGHVQATGRDARGRKQYLYHPAWQRLRDGQKFGRLEDFGARLPRLRACIEADLAQDGLPKQKVVAGVVRVIERSFARVGGERYAQQNASYGVATLQTSHVQVAGTTLRIRFRGKGGKRHDVGLDGPAAARLVRLCRRRAGRRLFVYEHEDDLVPVRASDVNAYIGHAMEGPFTSKDLRTWCATTLMVAVLLERGARDTRSQRMTVLRDAVRHVARRLHNTPVVCRRSYIHPAVPAAYFDGSLDDRVKHPPRTPELWPEERRLVALLDSYRAAGA